MYEKTFSLNDPFFGFKKFFKIPNHRGSKNKTATKKNHLSHKTKAFGLFHGSIIFNHKNKKLKI